MFCPSQLVDSSVTDVFQLCLIHISNAIFCQTILNTREVEHGKEYLVKWKELPYDECSWEMESDITSFRNEIEKFDRIHSQKVTAGKQKSNFCDAMEVKNRQKDFQQCESSPDFLSGGTRCSSSSWVFDWHFVMTNPPSDSVIFLIKIKVHCTRISSKGWISYVFLGPNRPMWYLPMKWDLVGLFSLLFQFHHFLLTFYLQLNSVLNLSDNYSRVQAKQYRVLHS